MRKPLQKNHTKKPTVGFFVFGNCRKVVAMIDYRSVEGAEESGWACVKARPNHLVAADVSRRSGRSRANSVSRGPLRTTDQSRIVIQNPPTHVGGYGASLSKSLIFQIFPLISCVSSSRKFKIALRNSLISKKVSDISRMC